jgi:hypothetical protein
MEAAGRIARAAKDVDGFREFANGVGAGKA